MLVDGDIGLRCADLMLNLQDNVVLDIEDVLDGSCTLSEALYPAESFGEGKVFLLPASQALRAAQVKQKDMTRVADKLKSAFDVVLMDGPAGIGRNTKLLLGAAERCFLVSTLDHVSLRDAEKTAAILDENGLGHPELILNRVRSEYVKAGLAEEPQEVAERLDMPLLGVIPESEKIYPALLQHRHPYECGDRAFRNAVDAMTGRALGEEIPFPRMVFSPIYRFFHQI